MSEFRDEIGNPLPEYTMHRTWTEWAPLPLRIVLAVGLIYHGFPKLFSAEEHQGFVGMLTGIGVPAPELAAWVVGIVEFVGGIMILLGAWTAIAAGLNIINMLVALFTVHLPNGFSFINMTGMGPEGATFGMPGYEVNLLYIGGLLALIIGGAGALSVDAARRDRAHDHSPGLR